MAVYTLPMKAVFLTKLTHYWSHSAHLRIKCSWPCLVQLASVEGLWEQGLCASNFEGSWISKTWAKGVGNLNVSLL